MKFLTLDYVKKHSRIDYDIEDDLLELYGKSAEDTTLNMLNRSYENLIETYGEVPPAIMQAALMLVEVSYSQRSPESPQKMSEVAYTYDALIKPYMIL